MLACRANRATLPRRSQPEPRRVQRHNARLRKVSQIRLGAEDIAVRWPGGDNDTLDAPRNRNAAAPIQEFGCESALDAISGAKTRPEQFKRAVGQLPFENCLDLRRCTEAMNVPDRPQVANDPPA